MGDHRLVLSRARSKARAVTVANTIRVPAWLSFVTKTPHLCASKHMDPFDHVLSLEDRLYEEGRQLGVADGSRAGRIEGRIFGLEKGFEKFAALGELHGRSAVWAARLRRLPEEAQSKGTDDALEKVTHEQQGVRNQSSNKSSYSPPPLGANGRMEKHVRTLYALVEPDSLPVENNEEAVSEVDDRLKRAEAKAKVIERLVGEVELEDSGGPGKTSGRSNSEQRKAAKVGSGAGGNDNMEDFGVLARKG